MAARLAGLGAVIAALALAFTAPVPLDYGSTSCRLERHCDDAAPAIQALAHGHVAAFFREQRLMGPVSEVVQAPFVAAAGDSVQSRYRAGLIPCLLALAAFGYLLARRAGERGWPWWTQLLVSVGAVLNPMTHWVLEFGHQEEVLAALLTVGSVVALRRERPGWAGVLAGLAIATKLWAVVALPLLVAAAPPRWRRTLGTAAATAVVILGASAIASPSTFSANFHQLGRLGSAPGTASRTDAWFPLVKPATLAVPIAQAPGGQIVRELQPVFRAPRFVGSLGHALVLIAAALLALAIARRRRPGAELWLALALALLLRCILDPGNRSYYHLAFLLPLLVYEVEARRAVPVLSIAAVALFEAFTRAAAHIHGDAALGAAYCAWSVLLAAALGIELWKVVSGRWSSSGATSNGGTSPKHGADTTPMRSIATSS